jgi:hypothetical protein
VDDGSMNDSLDINRSSAAYQFIWLNRFTPPADAFPFQLKQISVIWPTGQATVGSAVELAIYEDTDGDGNPINATYLASYTVTVQTVDNTTWNTYILPQPVILSGPGDVLIGVIDRFVNNGSSAVAYPVALDTSTSQDRSWIGWWAADPPHPPVLPPNDTFSTIDALGAPGNLMLRGSGDSITLDVPWLSEAPISGTLATNGNQIIDVTFDTMTYTVGTYSASIRILSNDPQNPSITIPVTLTIANFGVTLTPSTATLTGQPGEKVTYTLHLTNTGTTLDTFNLSISGVDAGWSANLPVSSIPLASGAGVDVLVEVTIPVNTSVPDTITVTATGSGGVSASSDLTTKPAQYKIYMPIIFR